VSVRWGENGPFALEASRPVYNPAFIAFLTHYRCKPIAVRRPQTKGKIEAPFLYVEKNLLNGRHFQDLDDLRATAQWWLREKSDPMSMTPPTARPGNSFWNRKEALFSPCPSRL